jgi:hypothetical protein
VPFSGSVKVGLRQIWDSSSFGIAAEIRKVAQIWCEKVWDRGTDHLCDQLEKQVRTPHWPRRVAKLDAWLIR